MKKLSIFFFAVAIVASITAVTNAQIKNVLLEQHTAAWCGWCVDGTVVMDEILDLYGEQVIGVKIHGGGDGMVIDEQSIIASALGLNGYPSGSVNRKDSGAGVFFSRTGWKSACEAQMQQKAKAEVDCFYMLDRDRRTVNIQVMANITEAMDGPLAFNAFIVEDNVTGTGSGFDQKNYISFRAGFQDNPYYDQPSTLYGYHHMKVVRQMLGGAWGVPGDLPEKVEPGEFYTFEFEAQLEEGWNIDELFFVGMMQADAEDNKEIINCAVAIENGLLLNRIIDSNAPTFQIVPPVSDFNNVYTLENLTDEDQSYLAEVLMTDGTPADWQAEFKCGDTELTTADVNNTMGFIVVPANSRVEFQLNLKVGSTLGMGQAKVVLSMEGEQAVKRSRMISAITMDIEKLLLETESDYSLWPYLSNTDHNDFIILNPGDYLAFADEMTNVKLVIWNKGPATGLSADEIDIIKNTEDVNHFICGDNVIGSLAHPDNLGYFGLEWIGWNLEAQGPTGTVWFSGQQGDIITGGLGENIEGHLMQYYINMVQITDTENVQPIMHFQNDGTRAYNNFRYSITADEAIFGVRSSGENARTVLLGVSPYIITDENVRRMLIKNILDWLIGDTGTEN